MRTGSESVFGAFDLPWRRLELEQGQPPFLNGRPDAEAKSGTLPGGDRRPALPGEDIRRAKRRYHRVMHGLAGDDLAVSHQRSAGHLAENVRGEGLGWRPVGR